MYLDDAGGDFYTLVPFGGTGCELTLPWGAGVLTIKCSLRDGD